MYVCMCIYIYIYIHTHTCVIPVPVLRPSEAYKRGRIKKQQI